MINANTRVSFEYHAINHKKQPVDLTFGFDRDAQYAQNLKLFRGLLVEALADVDNELKEATKK